MSSGESGVRPRVSVLILNWNGWEDSIECMESVLRQAYPDFQIILCDNDSNDGSVERIRAWAAGRSLEYVEYDRNEAECGGGKEDGAAKLVLIRNLDNLGFGGGNNVGLRYVLARGDAGYVWLLNNDTVADVRALDSLVRAASRDGQVGMVGSKILYFDRPEIVQAEAGGRVASWKGTSRLNGRDRRDGGEVSVRSRLDYITGASLLVKTDVIRGIGTIDERYFMYSEEVDWCLRARSAGWSLAYCPKSRVWHKEGGSVGFGSPLHDYFTTRNALLLVRTFHPALVPLAFGYSLYRCMMPKVVRRQPARLRAVLIAYRDFFSGHFHTGTAGLVRVRNRG